MKPGPLFAVELVVQGSKANRCEEIKQTRSPSKGGPFCPTEMCSQWSQPQGGGPSLRVAEAGAWALGTGPLSTLDGGLRLSLVLGHRIYFGNLLQPSPPYFTFHLIDKEIDAICAK